MSLRIGSSWDTFDGSDLFCTITFLIFWASRENVKEICKTFKSWATKAAAWLTKIKITAVT